MEKNIYHFMKEYGLSESRAVDVSAGTSPTGPSKKMKAAIRKAIKNIKRCPDPDFSRIKRLLTSKFGIPGNCLLFANSLQELIYLIPSVIRPEKVLIAGPAPDLYEEAARSSGAGIIHVHAGEGSGFALSAEDITRMSGDADLIFLANPNRFTGRLADKVCLGEIVRHAGTRNTPVVCDESLIQFTGTHGFEDRIPDNVMLLRTTAFFYGLPGLELAYAVSSAPLIERLSEEVHWQVNSLAVEAAMTALKDRAYETLTWKFTEEEKHLLTRSLRKTRGITFYPSDSNVFLMKIEHAGEDLMKGLSKEGFFVKEFRETPGEKATFIRMSLLEHDRMVKFVRVVKGIMETGK